MCWSALQHVLQEVAQHDMYYGMYYVLECVGTALVFWHTCLVLCHTCVAQQDMSYAMSCCATHAHHDMKAASRDWYIISTHPHITTHIRAPPTHLPTPKEAGTAAHG